MVGRGRADRLGQLGRAALEDVGELRGIAAGPGFDDVVAEADVDADPQGVAVFDGLAAYICRVAAGWGAGCQDLPLSIGVQKGPPIGVQKGPPSSSSVTGMTGALFVLVAA